MRKDKKGFTLIELIIVIAILAILTALITPKIQSYVEAANNQTDVANAQTMAREITYYYTLHPEELKYLQAFQNESPGVVEVLVLPDGVRFTTYRNPNSDNQKRAMCDVESIFDPTVKSCDTPNGGYVDTTKSKTYDANIAIKCASKSTWKQYALAVTTWYQTGDMKMSDSELKTYNASLPMQIHVYFTAWNNDADTAYDGFAKYWINNANSSIKQFQSMCGGALY
jgi:prepilin-type N-terminal cleavage/methylation domain-containing protein